MSRANQSLVEQGDPFGTAELHAEVAHCAGPAVSIACADNPDIDLHAEEPGRKGRIIGGFQRQEDRDLFLFRDNHRAILDKGALVLGISADGLADIAAEKPGQQRYRQRSGE
ncbi:MAG: hypothetical protein EA384_16850 [Spirochaetaceae bacterium]|nr:MAG: hypothetical protein EA384_16850 [Spirochaetaceae bacterium]